MKHTSTITIDLAKSVFQVALFNKHGKLVSNKAMTEAKMMQFIAQQSKSVICMEACSTAHYFGRKFIASGHEVKTIPAQIVAKYRSGNKNDANDALAIYEALKRPKIYFVKVKTIEQQDIATLLHLRKGYLSQKTQIVNRARGFASEYGVKMPQTVGAFKKHLPQHLESCDNELTSSARFVLNELLEQLIELEDKITRVTQELVSFAKNIPACQLLTSLPGVAWLGASALYARFGDGSAFKRGRDASACVGTVPSHSGSGGKNKLHGLSNKGDKYLRSLVMHGARSVVTHAKNKEDALSKWIQKLSAGQHFNQTVAAMANKIVRMALAVLKSNTAYNPSLASNGC